MSRQADASDVHQEVGGAVDRLAREFAGTFSRETVEQCVRDSLDKLGPMRVQTYRALFAYRFARERLRASARLAGAVTPSAPSVLLVCTHNAGRSQLAAAILEHEARGRVLVRSAGTDPAPDLHDGVREVLAELGVDASSAFPKPLTDEVLEASDVVVTMGCGDACPVLPGRRYLDWDLPDPAGQDLDTVRAVRDDIREHVRALLADLVQDRA
ncbi:MAG: arsenate reductase ArsC [Actinomycetes bacterium]